MTFANDLETDEALQNVWPYLKSN